MVKKIIEGKLIYFRNLNIQDIDNGWLKWVNEKEITRHMPYVKSKKRKELIEYLKKNKLPYSKIFAICLKNNGQYIGNARLSSIDKTNGTAIYGRLIGEKNFQGKGVGSEVLNLLCIYAFDYLKLNKIFCGVLNNNISSIKSNIKAGAIREGIWKNHVRINKKYQDINLYSIFKKNFKRKYAKKYW